MSIKPLQCQITDEYVDGAIVDQWSTSRAIDPVIVNGPPAEL